MVGEYHTPPGCISHPSGAYITPPWGIHHTPVGCISHPPGVYITHPGVYITPLWGIYHTPLGYTSHPPGACITPPTPPWGVYHTPLGRFSKVDCSTTKRVPTPNDTSSGSSPRDISNPDLLGTGTIPNVEISSTENRARGV